MVRMDAEQTLVALLISYMLLYRPARHWATIWHEYRLVYPGWLRFSRATAEAAGLLIATMAGLALAGSMVPRSSSSFLVAALTTLVVAFMLTELISRWVMRIRSSFNDPIEHSPRHQLLFRSRVLDLLFRQAIWSKLQNKTASVAELELTARDPVKRAAVLTEYVESAQRRGWIKIERKIAKLHEGYYWHPPVLTLLLVGLLVEYLQLSVAHLQARNYIESAELVRRSAAVVFGAAFYPLPIPRDLPHVFAVVVPHVLDVIRAAPFVMILLFCFGHPIARYALTLLIVTYFGVSLAGLPEAVAQWNNHPTVRQWHGFVDLMRAPVVGVIGQHAASLATSGMSDVALGFHQLWRNISPSAWLGVSLVLWAPFVFKLVRHIWISEIGNIYFARRIRRPLSCGAPADVPVPNNIVLGILREKTGWRPTKTEAAQFAASVAHEISMIGKPVSEVAQSAAQPAATAPAETHPGEAHRKLVALIAMRSRHAPIRSS